MEVPSLKGVGVLQGFLAFATAWNAMALAAEVPRQIDGPRDGSGQYAPKQNDLACTSLVKLHFPFAWLLCNPAFEWPPNHSYKNVQGIEIAPYILFHDVTCPW